MQLFPVATLDQLQSRGEVQLRDSVSVAGRSDSTIIKVLSFHFVNGSSLGPAPFYELRVADGMTCENAIMTLI